MPYPGRVVRVRQLSAANAHRAHAARCCCQMVTFALVWRPVPRPRGPAHYSLPTRTQGYSKTIDADQGLHEMRAGASNVQCGSRGDCRPSASESSVRGRRSRDDRHKAHHRPATPPHGAERTANWIALRRNVPVNRGLEVVPGNPSPRIELHSRTSGFDRAGLAIRTQCLAARLETVAARLIIGTGIGAVTLRHVIRPFAAAHRQ
jgi:hypothetical protein